MNKGKSFAAPVAERLVGRKQFHYSNVPHVIVSNCNDLVTMETVTG